MGFLDYIQEVEGHEISPGGRLLRMKRPVVNVLLGDFSKEERAELAYYPGRYANAKKCIFWCGIAGQEETDVVLELPAGAKTYGFAERARLQEYVKTSGELRETLQHFADSVFNQAAAGSMVFQNTGSIRMNFLVKADEAAAGMLAPLLSCFDEVFEPYYNGHRQKDIYLFMDQRAYLTQAEERKASNYLTLVETNDLMRSEKGRTKPQLVYFLSNFDSRGMIRPDFEKERARAFGMMMLLKDSMPDGGGHSVYSDEEFGDAAAGMARQSQTEPGMFASLGYLSLESNELLARLSAYRTVFESMRKVRTELPYEEYLEELNLDGLNDILRKSAARIRLSEMDWRSIPRSASVSESGLIGMPNEDCIEQLYGGNLELYLELNGSGGSTQSEIAERWVKDLEKRIGELGRRERLNPLEIMELLKRVAALLSGKKEDCRQRVKGSRDDFHKWGAARCGNMNKEKLPVTRESRTLYTQAQAFLNKRQSVYNDERKVELCEKLEQCLHIFLRRFAEYGELVAGACAELSQKICSIAGETPRDKELQVVNSEGYYSGVTEGILAGSRGYREMCEEIRNMVFGGEVRRSTAEEIYRKVYRFCDQEITGSIGFRREFMAEIFVRLKGYRLSATRELRSADDIADYVLRKIDSECKYHMFKSIYDPPRTHEEMCFLLDADSEFARANRDATDAVAVEQIRSKKLKLFCESGCERLEVLFLAGNIRLDELYQYESYRQAYEKLAAEG